MEWTDFSAVFKRVDICNRSTGLRDLSLDAMEADGCANCMGPCKGCISGCCGYWCCCKGCNALYCDHKASSKTMDISGQGRDDDFLDQMGAMLGGMPEGEEMER